MTETSKADLLDRVAFWKDTAEAYNQERLALSTLLQETVDQMTVLLTQFELARRVASHNANTAYVAVQYLNTHKAIVEAATNFVDSPAGSKYAPRALKEAVKDLDKCPTPQA